MNIFRIHLLLFFFLFAFAASGLNANTVIEGKAPDYKGQRIELLHYSNQIFNNEEQLAVCKVDSLGNFKLEFSLSETEFVFAHLGVYMVYLYAQPQAQYTVVLPPWEDKKPEDKLNPYFGGKGVHLVVQECRINNNRISSQNELNFYIRTFDDYFEPYLSKYAVQMVTQPELKDRDSMLLRIEQLFPDNQYPFFNAYRRYKMGYLRLLSLKNRSRSISNDYFLSRPILYTNPAYMDLFNEVYDKYFVFFGRTPKGRLIYDDINISGSYSRLWNTLSQDNVLQNDSLKELVILKGIHDGFYSTEFNRFALLNILDSLILTTHNQIHKKIGTEIRKKITQLMVGYEPPKFNLYDQAGHLRSLSDFKGKFVYLVFCTTQNYACLKENDGLKDLQQKHGDLLQVVTILADDKFEESKRYIRDKKLSWTFLHFGNQPEVLKDFDIRAFPTYFLIDREGKLAMSPAASPSENFEIRFFDYLKEKKVL